MNFKWVGRLYRRGAGASQKTCFILVGICLLSAGAWAQANLGRILGTVTDVSGGFLAGATVTVTDVARGITRTLTTDQAGEYSAPDLTPGTYKVRAELKGFKSVERSSLQLEVGKDIRVDLSMQPGEQAQTITVTEEPPMAETTNATLGGTLSNQTINDLPLNGRDYINLVTLRPGLTVYPGGGTSSRSSNGLRAEDIGYIVDGLRADEAYTGQSVLNAPIPAGDSSTALPIDAIQEFNTEENPKAEYGWKPGAVVNAGLKSGTNDLHGTAFAFGRDDAWDARNYFDPVGTLPKAPVALKQFGASGGGRIIKDKLFWFVNYEGQRYSVGSTYQTQAPATASLASAFPVAKKCTSLASGNCQLSIVDACNDIGRANVSPLSASIAGLPAGSCVPRAPSFTPNPATESLFPTNLTASPIVLGLVSTNQQDNGVAKVDYHINDKNSISGMYFNGRGGGVWNDGAYQVGVPGSGTSPFMSALGPVQIQLASGSWTYTPNSRWVNEAMVGYNRFYQPYLSVDSNVNPTAYGLNTGVTDPRFFGFPLIQISPFSYNNFHLGGNWPKIEGPDQDLEVQDHVSYLMGKHALKFGGEIIHNGAVPFVTQNGKGRIKFGSLEGFLAGKASGTGSRILVGDPKRDLHNWQYAGFFQDDWRLTQKITLNLGLRYEYSSVLVDANNQLGNFLPSVGLVQVGKQISTPFNGDHKNFSPRVGFAWDIHGNAKTVVRAGSSLMYEQLPLDVFIAVSNQLGINQIPTGAAIQVNGVTTPGTGNMGVIVVNVPGKQINWNGSSVGGASIFNTALVCGDGLNGDASPCNTEAVDPNLRNPYVATWNVSVEQAIMPNLSLEVAYVGTHGGRLLGFTNINEPPLGSGFTPAQILAGDPSVASQAAEQAARPFNGRFPYLANINFLSNIDRSNYNALQTTLTQRVSHGLSFVLGYTYGHALDDASSNFNANPVPLNSANPGLQYGSSDFDIRHRFTFTTSYMLPGRSGFGQLLKGWQLNSIVTLQSGSPWGVQDTGNDFSGTGQVNNLDTYGQTWNFFGNPSDFQSSQNPIPFCTGPSSCTDQYGNAVDASAAATLWGKCTAASTPLGPAALNSLGVSGCYVKGNSVLVPPALGTIGNSGRNVFRASSFRNWDLSVLKDWKFKERLTAQFRAEFFNVLNHPNFTNPFGPAGAGFNDASAGVGGNFGCGCLTPDQAAPNPVLGTGGNRSVQLGLKLIF